MSGLGEILDQNARLRQALDAAEQGRLAAEQGRLAAEQGRLAAEQELARRGEELAVVTKRADELAQELWLVRQGHRGPASQRYVPPEQGHLPMFSEASAPPREAVAVPPADEEETEKAGKKKRGRGTPRRRNRDAFAHLESQPVHCAAEPTPCPSCGETMKVVGTAESFRIEWVPGHFVRYDITRDKCACPACPSEGVLTAPGPFALDRSMAANGLVARVLVDKFSDHIPANRQAKRMQREGFEVGSHTLSSWIGKAGVVLSVIAQAIIAELLAGGFLQGDDTGMPVQDGGDGTLRKGRLWVFTDQQQAFYAFTDTKEGKFPKALLDGYAGDLLLVDGGSEFNEVVREQSLIRGGCWSHLRKRFFEALHHHPAEAHLALGTLKDLFLIERELRGRPPDEVVAVRAERSQRLVDGYFAWSKAMSQTVRPESLLGKALQYGHNQEAELRVFLDHGDVPMHNNLSELMLRQAVVGRKNWLFARSEGGAHAAATIYTLVGSCQLQGIDPWVYLRDVLGRVLDHPANRVRELTPKNWLAARQGHTSAAG